MTNQMSRYGGNLGAIKQSYFQRGDSCELGNVERSAWSHEAYCVIFFVRWRDGTASWAYRSPKEVPNEQGNAPDS
jgi:hypothetical protein